MRVFCCFWLGLICFLGFSQVPDQEELYHHSQTQKDTIDMRKLAIPKNNNDTLIKSSDLFYREDQFYIGIAYSLLQNKSNGISQSGFSLAFQFGFLRDIPLNQRRNVAVAIGMGYSIYDYSTNLRISKIDGDIAYTRAENFDKNKLSLHYLDVPLEFRWRTSTPKNVNFWRIYTGFKLSYLTFDRSKIRGDFSPENVKNNPDFVKFRYGLYLSAGHGSITFYANYSLNSAFEKAYINDKKIKLTMLNLGLMFYIL